MSETVKRILDVYDAVASGATHGDGGSFYADGKATLSHVSVPVNLLEDLAREFGREVYGREFAVRNPHPQEPT